MRLATAFDGSFYPAEPEGLAEVVDHFLQKAPRPPAGRVLGAVVPHAGYIYSGLTAGMAFGALRNLKPAAVVVLGPSHRVSLHGVRVLSVEGFETPLGGLSAAQDLSEELLDTLGPDAAGAAFCEHSVEVQLPFLARALPGIPVVEIIFGPPDQRVVRQVVSALRRALKTRDLLVVASTDLSHYYARPQCRVLDDRFRELLVGGDSGRLAEALRRGETEACGAGPVLTLMSLAEELGGRFEVVHQTDSSQASGDESQVVGYLSALAVLPRATE
jgi:AmmeMemoRadiSam system protein B